MSGIDVRSKNNAIPRSSKVKITRLLIDGRCPIVEQGSLLFDMETKG